MAGSRRQAVPAQTAIVTDFRRKPPDCSLVQSPSTKGWTLSLGVALRYGARIALRVRGRMGQAPILAAGGIVIRGGAKPLIAIVQRRKDNAWVLPKGKLKRNERAVAAARREVIEETGHDVFVHEYLGAISYDVSGRPKVVQFWRMQASHQPGGEPMHEIRAVEWLPLPSAIERLSRPVERLFLRNVGRLAVKLNAPPLRKPRTARKQRRIARATTRNASPAAAPTVVRGIRTAPQSLAAAVPGLTKPRDRRSGTLNAATVTIVALEIVAAFRRKLSNSCSAFLQAVMGICRDRAALITAH